MKRIFFIYMFVACALCAWAQHQDPRPVRTPEEEAAKQTEMLQRELELTQQQYDTIYRIHLKYAKLRQQSNTRSEMVDRLSSMISEVTEMLTPSQRQLFLSKQIDATPKRPHQPVVRMCSDSVPCQQVARPVRH